MNPETQVRAGHLCATHRNVLINLLREEPTLESLAEGRRAGDRLEAEFGPRIGVLTIVWSGMGLPSDEVRRQAAEDMRNAAERTVVTGTVIPGTGFRTSAFRTAYATLTLFSRSATPNKVFGDLREGVDFVAAHLDHEEGFAAELHDVVAGHIAELERLRGNDPAG